jgi:hypothetical protein
MLRAVWGEETKKMDDIVELCCNLDDITSEQLGFVSQLLMDKGAIDVYTTPVYMKKNRPGFVFTCMCRKEEKEEFLKLIFKHTTTLGVREYKCNRYGLNRKSKVYNTSFGKVRVKESEGYDIKRRKPEYEDIARISGETGKSIGEICEQIKKELDI